MTQSAFVNSYVIIGNGTAAIACVEGIRRLDSAGSITILSAEAHHCYSRPLISYLLQGKTTVPKMAYRGADFYEKNGVTFRGGVVVTGVNSGGRFVTTAGGEKIFYDKLLIATGSKALLPPIDGLDTVPSHSFLSLEDALSLGAELDAFHGKARVLIVGAGLIGMKCAEGIAHRAASVTIVEMADRILSAVLDRDAADILLAHITKVQSNITFRLASRVASVRGALPSPGASHGAGSASLNSGEVVPFDILVAAAGVRPNTELAAAARCAVHSGIVVDSGGAATVEGIYAAGDCAESADISSGENRVLALLPNAYLQGETAGFSMAAGAPAANGANVPQAMQTAAAAPAAPAFTKAIPLNAAGFFGLHLVTAGSYQGAKIDAPGGLYRSFYVSEDRLKGFIIVGDTARSGIYTALIREQTPLSLIDFDRIKTTPALMAFSTARRAEMLGSGEGEKGEKAAGSR